MNRRGPDECSSVCCVLQLRERSGSGAIVWDHVALLHQVLGGTHQTHVALREHFQVFPLRRNPAL